MNVKEFCFLWTEISTLIIMGIVVIQIIFTFYYIMSDPLKALALCNAFMANTIIAGIILILPALLYIEDETPKKNNEGAMS